MVFDPARIPDKLKEAYSSNRCAVLIGAGASAGAGLPLWGTLLERMADAALGYAVITPEKAEQDKQLAAKQEKYLMVASGLKDDLKSYFDEFVEDTFIKSKPSPTNLHKALVAVEKLQFVLTTNYDTLIERAYRE